MSELIEGEQLNALDMSYLDIWNFTLDNWNGLCQEFSFLKFIQRFFWNSSNDCLDIGFQFCFDFFICV